MTASLDDQLNEALEEHGANTLISPSFRRRKLINYGIRTALSAVLYLLFWKFLWVRWLLVVHLPLNLLSLALILAMPALLKRKIRRTRERIQAAEQINP